MFKKNLLPRLVLVAFVIAPFFFWHDFVEHLYVYLTGSVITNIIKAEWRVVVISIVLFLLFLIPLSFRRQAAWAEYGLVTAFFVSLFVEMYGIPFTLLFASKYMLSPGVVLPPNVVTFSLFGVSFGMDLAMFYGAIIMTIGGLLIVIGWITLYLAVKKQQFVTGGIYNWSRHPQYLGFILVIVGWLIGWPTIITIIFSPILIYKYIRVARTEEQEMELINPAYRNYKNKTPFLI